MRNITYESYSYKFSSLPADSVDEIACYNLRGAFKYFCEKISDLKLTTVFYEAKKAYEVILSFDCDGYHGLKIDNIDNNRSYGGWSYGYMNFHSAYKNNNNEWKYNQGNNQFNDPLYRSSLDTSTTLKCNSITIDESIRIIRFSLLNAYGSESYIIAFMSCPCVDYFTSKNMRACMYFKSDSSLARVSNGSYRSSLLTPTVIGGSNYPPRNLSVAAPVIVAGNNTNSNFYGYLVDSTFLYAGFTGNDRINYDFKSQVKISGKTFVQLFPNFLVRIT